MNAAEITVRAIANGFYTQAAHLGEAVKENRNAPDEVKNRLALRAGILTDIAIALNFAADALDIESVK